MPFSPCIPDKAGRGALCEQIDRLAKDYVRLLDRGERYEALTLERRLDQARRDFHRLYGQKEHV